LKTTKLSRDDLAKVSEELAKISQSMPAISKEIDTLNEDIKTQLLGGGVNSQQHQAENNIRDDLKALQNQLARLQDVQILIKDHNQAAVDGQRKLQDQLQYTMQDVGTYSRNQEEVLRQREAVGAVEHPAGQGGQGRNIPEVVGAMLQLTMALLEQLVE
jgi:chromosome segregation ATPase